MCGARFSFCEFLPFSLLPRPVLTSQPKEYKRMGDPARPWKARDGRWYQIVGASVAGETDDGLINEICDKWKPV